MNTAIDTRPQQSETLRPTQDTERVEAGSRLADTGHAPRKQRNGRTLAFVAGFVAATVAVGALAWNVLGGSTEPAVDPTTHDRVELSRAVTLGEINARPVVSDRVELNRAVTLGEINARPVGSDRVELNRAVTLSELNG